MTKKTWGVHQKPKSTAEEAFNKAINTIVRTAMERLREPGSIPSTVIKEAITEARKLKSPM